MRKIISILVSLIFGICSAYSVELWNGITCEMNETDLSEYLAKQFNAALSNKISGKFQFPSHDDKGHPAEVEYYYFFSEQEPFFKADSNSWFYDDDFTQNNISGRDFDEAESAFIKETGIAVYSLWQ